MTTYPLFNPFPDLPVPLPGKFESVEKLSKLDVVHGFFSSKFKVQSSGFKYTSLATKLTMSMIIYYINLSPDNKIYKNICSKKDEGWYNLNLRITSKRIGVILRIQGVKDLRIRVKRYRKQTLESWTPGILEPSNPCLR